MFFEFLKIEKPKTKINLKTLVYLPRFIASFRIFTANEAGVGICIYIYVYIYTHSPFICGEYSPQMKGEWVYIYIFIFIPTPPSFVVNIHHK